MRAPGDRRPGAEPRATMHGGGADGTREPRALSMGTALGIAIGVALLSAVGWAVLRGILELGVGLLAMASIGGWGIGAFLRQAAGPAWLAMALAVGAWLAGLVLTWVVAMALLPGSTRTFPERLEATPFVEWMAPQFGLLEVLGLLLYVVAAAYGARRPAAPG